MYSLQMININVGVHLGRLVEIGDNGALMVSVIVHAWKIEKLKTNTAQC